jgi:hypothetical protein
MLGAAPAEVGGSMLCGRHPPADQISAPTPFWCWEAEISVLMANGRPRYGKSEDFIDQL